MAKKHKRKNKPNGFLKSFLFSSLTTTLTHKALETIIIPKTKTSKFIRKNYANRDVNLYGGIVTGANLVINALPIFRIYNRKTSKAMLIATSMSTVSGLIDDLDNGKSEGDTKIKGFKGHLAALSKGRVTTGVLKIVGISSASCIASFILTNKTHTHNKKKDNLVYVYDYLLNAGIIASTANLHNLLDLRPGRCLKFSALMNASLLFSNRNTRNIAISNLCTISSSLPSDLSEKTMLGDTGANALGSSVGVAIASVNKRGIKSLVALGVLALNLLSEKVSFSKIISSNKMLKKFDDMGRIHE